MRAYIRVWSAVGLLLLAACSAEELSESIYPEEVRKELNRINDAIITRNVGAILANSSDLGDETVAAGVRSLFQYLPEGAYVDREIAASNWFRIKGISEPDRTTYSAEYQYEHTGGWAYVSLRLVEEVGVVALRNIQIVRLPKSLRETNAFTFEGKPFLNYVIFGLAVAVPVFILVTFVTCALTPKLRRKKRWLIFILFGIGVVTLNWTTGTLSWPTTALGFKILSVNFLGAGYRMASVLAPVMLSVSLPVGAILFWFFRQSGRLAFVSEPPEEIAEDAKSGETQTRKKRTSAD